MAKAPNNSTIAADYCRRFPDTPSKTLARKMYAEHIERFTTLEHARLAIRICRGNCGNKQRRSAENLVKRPNGQAGWKPECPPSAAEGWQPIEIAGPCRALILSDAHLPYHSKEAIESAVDFGKKFKPDLVLLNGDTLDNYRVSRFQQDPKKRTLKQEIEDCKHFLSWLRGQFRKARIIYKLGNHDERWDHFIWNKCVELWDIENLQLHNILEFEKYGIERVDDNPIMLGELPVLHGHELQKSLGVPVNQARSAFLKTIHSVLVGHGHRTSTHCEPDMFGREITTWSTGCLCAMNPEYARFAKWNWGFATVEVAADKQFNVQNLRISKRLQVRTA